MKWKIVYGDACTGCQSNLLAQYFERPEDPLVTLGCWIPNDIDDCPQIGTLNLFTLAGIETPDWAKR